MSGVEDNRKYRCKTCGAIYHYETAYETATPCRTCGDVNYEQIRITTVCDFCSSPDNVVWTYPCHDFVVATLLPGLPDERKVGAWAACGACHDLIEAGAWDAVAERAIESHQKTERLPAKAVRMLQRLLLSLHQQFRDNRAGPAYRHKEDTDASV